MNLKKLFLTGVLVLLTLPFALADEIGTGKTDTTTSSSSQTMQASDEIGTGAPTTSDEIGTGSEAEAMLAWWSYLLRII